MKMKEIVDRIIYFRTLKEISARELSLNIGKSGNYISKLECLDFTLPTPMLLTIIDNLGIKPEEFFAEDYKNYKDKKNLLNLLEDVIKYVPEDTISNLLNSLKK